jgi:hypothetical protein
VDTQYSILEFRFHFVSESGLGETESPLEGTIGPLNAMESSLAIFFLFSLTSDTERTILKGHFDILFFHFGQIRLDSEFFVVLGNVDQGCPFALSLRLTAAL